MAVCILIQIGKVGPVLAEDGSGQKEGAVRRFQLIAEGLPLEKVRLCLASGSSIQQRTTSMSF